MTQTHDRHTGGDLTLVTTGTGTTGSRVADRLGAERRAVRIGSRRADPPFDRGDRDTWDAALRGSTAAYVAYVPDLGFPGAADDVGAFARAAADHGVRRLVLLSGRGEEQAQRSEEAVRWDGHEVRTNELTGPEPLWFADAELSRATGREIAYVPVSAEEYTTAALAAGVPAEEVEPLTELFASVLDGRNVAATGDVERVLGRPARDFATYTRTTAATGVWDAAGREVAR